MSSIVKAVMLSFLFVAFLAIKFINQWPFAALAAQTFSSLF
jgi:hypothetical protein